MSKPATIYRSLLRDAFNVTWNRKSLWVFGIFAGFVSAGGVIDTTISGLRRISQTGNLLEKMLDRSFIGYSYASEFIVHLTHVGGTRIGFMLGSLTVVLLGLIIAGVLSQAALVHASGTNPKHPREIRKHVVRHFWPVLLIDLFTKILSILLTALSILPVFLLLSGGSEFSWIVFVHLIIYIPAMVIIQIISMLAITDAVEADARALHAITHALNIFKKHWLSAIEFGLIVFLLVIGATLLLVAVLGVLSLPYGLAYGATLASGSVGMYIGVNILTALIVLSLIFAFGGAVVTFQYSAWRMYYKHSVHRLHGKKPFAKLFRRMFA